MRMSFREFMGKMQLIGNVFGEENITIANNILDLIRVDTGNEIVNIESFNIEKYIEELNKSKQTTLARLERINNRLENAKKIQEIIDK